VIIFRSLGAADTHGLDGTGVLGVCLPHTADLLHLIRL
jgi:hypothetical protein